MIDPSQIQEEEKTPLVMELLHLVQQLSQDNQRLKDEIARLKEHKGKPKIPPSRLEKDPKKNQKKILLFCTLFFLLVPIVNVKSFIHLDYIKDGNYAFFLFDLQTGNNTHLTTTYRVITEGFT